MWVEMVVQSFQMAGGAKPWMKGANVNVKWGDQWHYLQLTKPSEVRKPIWTHANFLVA